MNLEIQRKNIVHRILEVENPKLLNKIEELLDQDIFAFKTDGTGLSRKEYETHISKILKASEETENTYATEIAKTTFIKNP